MKLTIRNLTAGYDGEAVLRDLSLTVQEGGFLSLLGPSGCGKTTLMKAIAGILPVSAGTIFLDGEEITSMPIHRRGTVIMFQDIRLFPHKNVAENVAFPLKMQGVPRAEWMRRAEELLEKVQLAGYGKRSPGELSGGQQQRVALARALAAKPKLLLLDEPFSALDENLREEMRSLVLRLKEEFRMTVILVTHDREEALSMSDCVALMFDGKLVQTGTPREVYTCPVSRQAADYFGNCVYIRGTVADGCFRAPGICFASPAEAGSYTLMLRPDALDLESDGTYPVTVEGFSFRGRDTLVTLRSADGTLWKKAYTGQIRWQPGTVVKAGLQIREPVLFPDRYIQNADK